MTFGTCVCNFRCPACNGHALCFHRWPVKLYNIFSTPSHKRHDFRKKKKSVEHKMCVLRLSTTFVWKVSHSKKKRSWCDQKSMLVFMYSTRYSRRILMQFEFSRKMFEKFSNTKFNENLSSGVRVPCEWGDERTHRQTDSMTKLIFAIRNFANAPKNDRYVPKRC
jgi:hypothetical protein